jgi:hypothetical protein
MLLCLGTPERFFFYFLLSSRNVKLKQLCKTTHFKCYFVWERSLFFALREQLYFEMLIKLVKTPEDMTVLERSRLK